MATVGDIYDPFAIDHTASPIPSSASVVSSISDILSVSEPASALDPTDTDPQHGQGSRSMSLKSHLSLRPHPWYYLNDGMIDIGVEDTVFRIPRSIFAQNSTPFSEMIQNHDRLNASEHSASTLFLNDKDVTSTDFERLLDVLYPLKFGEISVTTLEEWISVLHLASKWSFHAVRALAIERLATLASPVDKVVLGRKYDIQEWLLDAYTSLCERPEPLTLEEGLRMTMEDVIKISEARHRVRVYSRLVAPHVLRETMCSVFGLSHPNIADETVLQPLDTSRVATLVKEMAEQNSTDAHALLEPILLSYHAKTDAMDAVLKIIAAQVVDENTKHPDRLRQLVIDLTMMVHSACTDGSSTGPSGEPVSGPSWLVDRLVVYCTAAVDGWSVFKSGNGSWSATYAMSDFLSSLVDAKIVQEDVFVPWWQAISHVLERPAKEWAQHLFDYFCDGRSDRIRVASCSPIIDDFYKRFRAFKDEYGKQPGTQETCHIYNLLKDIATRR